MNLHGTSLHPPPTTTRRTAGCHFRLGQHPRAKLRVSLEVEKPPETSVLPTQRRTYPGLKAAARDQEAGFDLKLLYTSQPPAPCPQRRQPIPKLRRDLLTNKLLHTEDLEDDAHGTHASLRDQFSSNGLRNGFEQRAPIPFVQYAAKEVVERQEAPPVPTSIAPLAQS